MEILYRVHNGLYVNLTNRCSAACTFCLRQTMDHVGQSHSLWLEREPTAEEVIAEFKKWELDEFSEIVFCGFGEPTCALDVLLPVATWLKTVTDKPIRVNTNGHGSLIAGRDISGELAKCVDTVSVSLNHPDPERYQALVRSRFGGAAYEGMLRFAESCVKAGMHVILTTVDTTITHEEEARCQEICDRIGASYRIRPWED
ncbi:MAG: TatD family nuclease-associated radical SAM protein [Oscillospiraceae bacterium]|nr:TatD family nuclease-associated radical SAM protein [Oscillospiraceae bacterium]